MADEPVVWASGADRLCNYLLPESAPRITYYADADTGRCRRYLGSARSSSRSKAIGWINPVVSIVLLPSAADSFGYVDECAS
jgi:hypothetical protein